MKILVTGSAGFIASHVVKSLLEAEHDVIGLDSFDMEVHPAESKAQLVDTYWADLKSWKPLSIPKFDAVIHFASLGGVSRAARDPKAIIEANCIGTANLVEVLKERCPTLKYAILASSFSVYGSNYKYICTNNSAHEGTGYRSEDNLLAGQYEVCCPHCGSFAIISPVTETTSPSPLELYATSKYTQEVLWRAFDCQKTVFRFSSVYGSGMRLQDGEATIIAKLAGQIKNGECPKLFEDGKQMRDWTYVGDICKAMLTVLRRPPKENSEEIINVCSGEGTSLIDGCKYLSAAYQHELPIQPDIVGGYRPGDMRHCVGDPSKLEFTLGIKPTLFKDGVKLAFGRDKE